ncbi:MAG: hypothetical protein A4E37_01308 [Methanoregulaceae archaeon PtaB.Bin056]|jgi:hypothetical protein|nr:MAG: hypothetical protein A4E37_01308 [Methanoregulaceae archaeon PtaB.Bin056]
MHIIDQGDLRNYSGEYTFTGESARDPTRSGQIFLSKGVLITRRGVIHLAEESV